MEDVLIANRSVRNSRLYGATVRPQSPTGYATTTRSLPICESSIIVIALRGIVEDSKVTRRGQVSVRQ